jgi:cytochrome-b5 reductase
MMMLESGLPFVISAISIIVGFIVALVFLNNRKSTSNPSENRDRGEDVSRGLRKEIKENKESSHIGGLTDEKVLSPSQFRQFKVLKVVKISYNTKLIRFEIHPDKTLGLTIGRHISVRADIDGNKVIRPYTPTSRIDQKGYFELLVKNYEFGKMSNYLHSLKVGQVADIRGPVGRFHYHSNKHPKIGLIAAGTGITPCLQFIRNLFLSSEYSKEDQTQLILFYQNRTEEDILLFDDLQHLEKKYPERLSVVYFLSNPSPASSMKYGASPNEKKGYINEEMIGKHMHGDACPFVCVCGPSGFNDSMKKLLASANHDLEKTVFIW